MRLMPVTDAMFLVAETRETPMHVGGVNLYTLPDKVDETEWLNEMLALLRQQEGLRRPFSEAMDKLVGAVRMGCSVEHAQKLGGAATGGVDTDGMVRAKPALPAPIWRVIMKRLGTRAQSDI